MESKYIKTWETILEENNDCPEQNIAPMKAKMMKSEDIIFQYVINLLL